MEFNRKNHYRVLAHQIEKQFVASTTRPRKINGEGGWVGMSETSDKHWQGCEREGILAHWCNECNGGNANMQSYIGNQSKVASKHKTKQN